MVVTLKHSLTKVLTKFSIVLFHRSNALQNNIRFLSKLGSRLVNGVWVSTSEEWEEVPHPRWLNLVTSDVTIVDESFGAIQ